MAGTDDDLYLVLGLDQGLESTGAEIKKAYRKKALESHPDKRPDDKNAAAEFDKIQKAYEILGDEKARKAYDDLQKVQRARANRDAQKGAKRQKMMDDLKKREEAFVNERSAEEIAKMKLKAEIARVRQEGLARQKRQAEELAAAQKEARNSSGASASTLGGGSTLLQGETLTRTLKVSWDRTREGGIEDYGAEKLRAVFVKFGPVEDIIIKEDGKKKKKGSALVVMASEEGAAVAIGAVCGDLTNPLLVKPAVPGMVPGQGGVKKQGYDGVPGGVNGPVPGEHSVNGNKAAGVNGPTPRDSVNKDAPDGLNGSTPAESVNRHMPDGVDKHPPDGVTGQHGAGTGTAQTDASSGNVSGKGGVNEDQGVRVPADDERGGQGDRRSGAGVGGGGGVNMPHVAPGTNGSQRPNIFANGPARPLFGGTTGAPNPGACSSATTAAPTGSHKDYENVTLMRMRQAAERARLIRELEEQDAREAEAEKGA